MSSPERKKKTITVSIDEELFCKLMEYHISAQVTSKAALKAAVGRVEKKQKNREKRAELEAVRSFDPRMGSSELTSSSPRVRRIRRLASVYVPPPTG